jgi:transcriptional regulator with XRE-family HTH domain
MQAIEPFLDEQRRVPDQRLAGVCEAVYRATLAYNQMRRWLPINTLDFLVSRGYVSGDPDYLDRTYIAYADGTRLRQARLARGFTADHLADLATMLGATLSLSTLLRAENNNLPLFGDRLTALALALGVPEECLTREGPELPDPLPPLDEQGLVRAALPAPTPEVKPATKEEASMPVPNQDEIRRDETQRTQEDKPPTLFARLRQEANGEELRLSQIMRLWVQQVHEMEEELDAARNTNVQAELETAEVALRELRLQLEQVQQENRRLTGLYGRQKIVIDNQRATLQRLEEQLITGDGAEPHAEATPAPGR